jgi:hypothetical protein
VISITDNIIVFGSDEMDHNKNLDNLMKTAEQKNLVFNADKCHIKCSYVTFFSNVYNKDGVHPDPQKVQGIKDILEPQNVKKLQSLHGFMTHLSSFIPKWS